MRLNVEQRTKLVEFYLTSKSAGKAAEQFRDHYGLSITRYDPKVPRSTILRLVKKFKKTGSVHDMNRSGKPKASRSPENLSNVDQSVTGDRRKLVRRRSQELGLSRSSLSRILLKDLNMHPYKDPTAQTLSERDKHEREGMW